MPTTALKDVAVRLARATGPTFQHSVGAFSSARGGVRLLNDVRTSFYHGQRSAFIHLRRFVSVRGSDRKFCRPRFVNGSSSSLPRIFDHIPDGHVCMPATQRKQEKSYDREGT